MVALQFDATPNNLKALGSQDQKIHLHTNECILYVKFVGLTPLTLSNNQLDLTAHLDAQPGFILTGTFDDIKEFLNKTFDKMSEAYKQKVEEFNG